MATCLILARIASIRRGSSKVAWWKQILLILVGYLVLLIFEGIPTGPGIGYIMCILITTFFGWAIGAGLVIGAYLIIARITRERGSSSEMTWWKLISLILVGYLIVFVLGGMLISPTGPGSDRIAFILLLIYSCCLILLGTKPIRVVGLALAMVFLLGVVLETKERWDFERRMEQRTTCMNNIRLIGLTLAKDLDDNATISRIHLEPGENIVIWVVRTHRMSPAVLICPSDPHAEDSLQAGATYTSYDSWNVDELLTLWDRAKKGSVGLPLVWDSLPRHSDEYFFMHDTLGATRWVDMADFRRLMDQGKELIKKAD